MFVFMSDGKAELIHYYLRKYEDVESNEWINSRVFIMLNAKVMQKETYSTEYAFIFWKNLIQLFTSGK